MKDVTISEYTLRFDWGTFELIGAITGNDPSNPLLGITAIGDQAAFVLYGALARVDERAERPIKFSIEQVKKMLKDFSGVEIAELLGAYVNSARVNGMQSTDEEKKS